MPLHARARHILDPFAGQAPSHAQGGIELRQPQQETALNVIRGDDYL